MKAQWHPGIHVSVIRVMGEIACEPCANGPVHDGFNVGHRMNKYHGIVDVNGRNMKRAQGELSAA